MAALEQFGRYRAVRRLGVGAFATVWLARDEQLDGSVAVKVLADNWASRGDVRERFLEEARMLRRADSDRVVRVHDIGELDDGRPYFVMTYADLGILADRLTDFPMPLAEALWYAHETALGVAVLHARGIIHRDVKPSNVLLRTGDGDTEQVLVSDLGLAKAAAIASGITLTAGTPGYMPPEQAHGVGLTFASDVYALGALTYRLVAGRLPHQVGSPLSVLSTAADPVPALEFAAGLPRELDAVLRRALSRDPADRQADAQAFARALSGAAGDLLAAGAVLVPNTALAGGAALLGGVAAAGGARETAWTTGGRPLSRGSAGWDRDDLATVITRTRPVDTAPPRPAPDDGAADPDTSDPDNSDRDRDGDDVPATPRRSHRGRTTALVCLLTLAVVLSGGLVAAVAEPGWVAQARAVLAGNRVVQRDPLSVTVPAGWSQLGAVAGPVPGMGRPADQLTVSRDVASYRSLSGAPGVFLALAAGDDAAGVRSAVRYPGCTGPVPQQVDAPAGWSGAAASRTCGTTRVLTWVGTDGAGRTLVVEVKVGSDQQALADRVLSSVSVTPAAGS